MARTMHYRDWAHEAYARARAKCDRGKREGPDPQCGAGARKNDHLGGKISPQNNERERDGQRSDRVLENFRQHGDIMRLRRSGKTLEEIAVETGHSRLNTFRTLQRVLSHDQKLTLGLPT
jgi:hypothetical protein